MTKIRVCTDTKGNMYIALTCKNTGTFELLDEMYVAEHQGPKPQYFEDARYFPLAPPKIIPIKDDEAKYDEASNILDFGQTKESLALTPQNAQQMVDWVNISYLNITKKDGQTSISYRNMPVKGEQPLLSQLVNYIEKTQKRLLQEQQQKAQLQADKDTQLQHQVKSQLDKTIAVRGYLQPHCESAYRHALTLFNSKSLFITGIVGVQLLTASAKLTNPRNRT